MVMDIVEKAIIAKYKKVSELHPETARWPIDFDEEEQREEREIMASVIKEFLLTCNQSLQVAPWKCPIGKTDCNENCGNYGCGN